MNRYIALISVVLFAQFCCAETLYVPKQYATIQSALDAAAVGDTVELSAGDYHETITMPNIDNVTLQGSIDNDGLPISRLVPNEGGLDGSAITINSPSMTTTVIKDLYISGSSTMGGGMLISGTYVSITNCTFENCFAADGGAVAFIGGNPYERPMFTNCRFLSNAASRGGAIWGNWNNGSPNLTAIRLEDCTFDLNEADAGGGALFIYPSQYSSKLGFEIILSTFTNNFGLSQVTSIYGVSSYSTSIYGSNFCGVGDHINGTWQDLGDNTFESQCAASCTADLDGDGEVKVADLLLLIGAWGPCPGCDADLDGDGEVKVSDLLLLIAAWGVCP